MIYLLQVDYSLEKACRLIDMTLRIGDVGDQGPAPYGTARSKKGDFLHAENDDLAFVLDFVNDELSRYEKEPLEPGSFEDGMLELDTKLRSLAPLKILKSCLEDAIRSEGEGRQGSLLLLAEQSLTIGAGVAHRARIIDAAYPGMRARAKPGCPGFKGPEEVLKARQEERNKAPAGKIPS
jgi:hypothetical protein